MQVFTTNRRAFSATISLLLIWAAAASGGPSDKGGTPQHRVICFEAEHANEVTPILHVDRKQGASGGMAIAVPEGAACRQPSKDPGHATYCLQIPQDGTYHLWFRIWWQGTCSNSLFASLKPVLPRFTLTGNTFNKWHWVHGPMAQLKAGPAELRLHYREDGCWIDQILLTQKLNAKPHGPLKPNVVPSPPREHAEMTVSLSAAAISCDALAAPRLRVTHHTDRSASIPNEQSAVVIPRQETKLTAWIRNNPLQEGGGSVSFLTKSKLTIQPGLFQDYRLAAGQALAALDFTLSAPADIERRSHVAVLRTIFPSGKVVSCRLNVTCPFKWLCSEPVPMTTKHGIDAPHPIEQAPHPLQVGTWRLAPDACITPIGLLDMRKAVSKRDFITAYAYTEVRPPAPGTYLLHTANDDMMKVWVNGRMVHRDDSEQPTSATRALTPIELVDGRNRILVKLCQKRNFWEFLLEIRNADGSLSQVTGCDVERLSFKQRQN